MTEQKFEFESVEQRKFAYIAGLAYAYPERFLNALTDTHTTSDAIRTAAGHIASTNDLDMTSCVNFMASCSQYEFPCEDLNLLMDRSYIWEKTDEALGLPFRTFTSIGIGVDMPYVHEPDSKPED